MKEVKNRYKKIGVLLLFVLLLGSNCIGFVLYYRESKRVKTPFVYDLSGNSLLLRIFHQNDGVSESVKVQDVLEVPLIDQRKELPNGCEIASTVMVLQYYGFSIDLLDFSRNYVDKQSVYNEGGRRYGPDPSSFFAGDPESESAGWGAFPSVLMKSVEKFLESKGVSSSYEIEDLTGQSLSSLEIDTPILVWTTIDYEECKDFYIWLDRDGKNQTYFYPKNSHTVVLVGSDETYFYINDPLRPEEVQKVSRELFIKAYDSVGRGAFKIIKK